MNFFRRLFKRRDKDYTWVSTRDEHTDHVFVAAMDEREALRVAKEGKGQDDPSAALLLRRLHLDNTDFKERKRIFCVQLSVESELTLPEGGPYGATKENTEVG